MNTDWIGFWASITPEKTAIITSADGKSYSYSAINAMGGRLSALLSQKFGIQKTDRICIIAENRIEYIYLFAHAQKTGTILVPLNYRLTQYETSQLINDADPKIVIYEEQFRDNIAFEADRQYLEIEELNRMLSGYSSQMDSDYEVSLEETLFILYTSGSTGFPKGVCYTHKMMLWNSINTSISLGLDTETKTLVCMPPFHTGGWNVLLSPVLHHGGTCIMMKKFDASIVLNELSSHKCTQFMGVPTMLKMMTDSEAFDSISLDRLKYILVGGEAMPIPLIERYNNKGILIRQGFGMTEVGPNITSLHHDDALRKIGSIGKPNMYVELCLKDPDGKPVPANTRGELCFRGPIVTPGYWNNNTATEHSIRNGWLHSGDVAVMDDEGYLFIVDRIKNMYISGGENVYPAEIERILNTHPDIAEVSVIGVPHEKWGEVGKAFIVRRSNKPSEDELKSFCLESLSKFKVPKHFRFLDELPKNAAGKIDKMKLKSIR